MTIQITTTPSEPLRAAQYLRMSTDYQQYSLVNQAAAISLYAAAHNFMIVRSYVDPGRSGVTIKSRPSLQELIRTVQCGRADFDCILVYDVSRWGRFQDLDEAAHYEYICRSAGIHVCYCAEQFENDNSMLNSLLKFMKRMMAGEYSRELSAKVWTAHARCAGMGFSQGSLPPYGLRRMLVDAQGNRKQVLSAKEQKALVTDRVIFVPGPPQEICVVQDVFNRCTQNKQDPIEIAHALNQEGVAAPFGQRWTSNGIRRLISNEKYVGTYVYGRTSQKLHAPLTRNEPQNWIVKKDAIVPIIAPMQFDQAQHLLHAFLQRRSTEHLLDNLRRLLKKKRRLSVTIINREKGTPRSSTYARRFGSLRAAFSLVGFEVPDYSRREELTHKLREFRVRLRQNIIDQLRERGVHVSIHNKPHMLTLNHELKVEVRVLHKQAHQHDSLRTGWVFEINFNKGIDVLISACLDRDNERIEAQYIIPRLSRLHGCYWSGLAKGRVFLEAFRSATLQPLLDAVCRVPIST